LTDCYPIRLFAGFDEREEVGYHAFCSSVIERSTVPVSFTPLSLNTVQKVYGAGHRDGSNGFIYLRFLIPYLQQYEGWAIFVDGADMICNADIAELWALRDPFKAVQVVKHDYKTKNPRKYVGTAMESVNADYPKKQWSSVMLINCAHYAWREMTPEKVAAMPGSYLHRFEFIPERYIGDLPKEWNHLVMEQEPSDDAKLIHFTLGVPGFPQYRHCEHADKWFGSVARMNHATH
jgi:lipopolysaccharide biosynthesis glycosyltransferase